ncbi:MFS transporter [Thiocystis violascens]|uniref:Arabinose efflux permease family protein n=1 Tax=Thiocystis violascens (strain ATCC 17096 / DSM 198 / 6111) TaxID=765911 RepID=I3Y9Q6_THIV6|nr:MFS transporter [Thiocystis violascens]AFL73724.1 arabinose efflux permease family protein [Thiocystis violascens DSM 198]
MPYWRLSAYYLCYFASLGALVPYWGLYLQSEGFDALAIGQLLAILSGTKIVAPMVWGHIVDLRGRRMPMVRLGALLSVLAFVTVFFADGFWSMAAAMVLFSFFWNASLPQVEAVTFNHLRQRPTGYALVRLWGSVGFILVVAVLGLRLERDSLAIVPVWVLMLFLGVWLSSLTIPDSAPVQDGQPALSLRALLRRQEVLAFFAACFLMQLGHGIYYAFYSIHLEAAGYSSVAVGNLWALGVIAEVLVFLIMHRLLDRFGARRVLLWSLGLAILRWLLIGAFIDVLSVQAVAQLLHAATFGTFHASAIHLVHHAFPGRTQGRGQALYNSLSFGAGGAAGSLLGGLLWDGSGALVTFGVAAGAAAVGLIVAWRWADL